MRAVVNKLARVALHRAGAIELLIRRNRKKLAIVTFHHFSRDRGAVEELDERCRWIRSHFTPVTLDQVADALERKRPLPPNPVTITVDDGYNDFLVAHPVFQKHGLPVTVFVVTGFLDRVCWLWVDEVRYLIQHTQRKELSLALTGVHATTLRIEDGERCTIANRVISAAKKRPDEARREMLAEVGEQSGVKLPPEPPDPFRALTWDQVRWLKSDGVGFGSHTHTHPIVSKVSDRHALSNELRIPRERIASELGEECKHFCYPNGKPEDISPEAVGLVAQLGYRTAVTTTVGLNVARTNPYQLARIGDETGMSREYFYETMAGLHSDPSR